MNYCPKPGTVPALVIAWLEDNEAEGGMVPAEYIRRELGVVTTAFSAKLDVCIREGLLTAEKRRGSNGHMQWFVGLGLKPGPAGSRLVNQAIAFLRTLPPGTQVKSPDLADALGIDSQSAKNMRKRVTHDCGIRLQVLEGFGAVYWWSLSEFEPITPEIEEDAEIPPRRHAPDIQPRPGPWFPGINSGAMA